MSNLFTILFIVGIFYFMFRKGGMGCCGGHGNHGGHGSSAAENKNRPIDHSALHKEQTSIMDLNEADYAVLPLDSKGK